MGLRSIVVEVVDGQFHSAVDDGRRRLDDGECNLDDAAHALRIVPFPAIVPIDRLCGHCWPDGWSGPTTRDSSHAIVDGRNP